MLKNGLVLLLIICGFIGCFSNRITKCYDFSAPAKVIEHKDLTVVAAFIGTLTEGEKVGGHNITVKSNPYGLLIQIKSISFFYKSARMTSLRIEDSLGRSIGMPKGTHYPTSDFLEDPSGYTANLSIDGFELSYETHHLTLDLEIQTRANSRENLNIIFSLSPEYKEEKANDTWKRAKVD